MIDRRKLPDASLHRILNILLIGVQYSLTSMTSFKCLILTAQEMTFSIKDFFSKRDEIRRKLCIWLHLLGKFLMENFIFCEVSNECQ